MVTVSSADELRGILERHRAAGRTVGFVPTMGFLHDGHASLMRAAAADTDIVVVSIFVNPLQFAPDEDLEDYPRDLARDTEIATEAGVRYLFVPDRDEMYPIKPVATTVSVDGLSEGLEATTRPTHFAGVATVVTKLFAIVGPCRSYFGEKDYQQLAVITRMVIDLSLPVTVVGCPIIREPNGLAMSSRNTYLTPEERTAASVLRRALDAGVAAVEAGEQNPTAVTDVMAAVIAAEPLAELDYAAVVDAASLEVPQELSGELRLLIAAQMGKPRLIDNCGVTAP
ncbi:MAG: pantoate--beta-alanine ligase [Actinomycetota bacterium]